MLYSWLIYRTGENEETKKKLYKKYRKHRQRFTAKEKLNEGMKIARYKPEPFTTIELGPPHQQKCTEPCK